MDVWIVTTVAWKREGVLEQYKPAGWDKVYNQVKDRDGYYTGVFFFAFSNVTEGASPLFRDELLAAARAVARPGATAVLRTLGRPRSQEDASRAATDRALIWGGIEVVMFK